MINKIFVHYKLQVNINCAPTQRMKRRDAGIFDEGTQTWDVLHTSIYDHRISPSD
jgi:hypothetical protein